METTKINTGICEYELWGGARLPEMKTEGAAGYDLYVPENTIIPTGRFLIPLHFKMRFAFDLLAAIKPRSGFSAKGFEGYPMGAMQFDGTLTGEPRRFDCDVIVGSVDSDYPDEVHVIVKNYEQTPFIVAAGTRIAQLVFERIEHPKSVAGKIGERAARGGFGSTGTK